MLIVNYYIIKSRDVLDPCYEYFFLEDTVFVINLEVLNVFFFSGDGSGGGLSTRDTNLLTNINDLRDGYESISEEEFDIFDDPEDLKLPQPVSVMDVDWRLLSKMNKPGKTKGYYNTCYTSASLSKCVTMKNIPLVMQISITITEAQL